LTLCFFCLFSDGSRGGDPITPYFKTKLKPEGPKTIWMTGPPPLSEGLDPPLFVCLFFQSSLRKKQPLRIATYCGSYHGHTMVFGYVLTPFSLSTEQSLTACDFVYCGVAVVVINQKQKNYPSEMVNRGDEKFVFSIHSPATK